jgi:Flp pilus assembly pilin Flp
MGLSILAWEAVARACGFLRRAQHMGRQRMVRQRMVRRSLDHLWRLWHEDEGQDIAEYAVMLAVILVIVVGTIRLIGSNANNVFSNVASSIQ